MLSVSLDSIELYICKLKKAHTSSCINFSPCLVVTFINLC